MGNPYFEIDPPSSGRKNPYFELDPPSGAREPSKGSALGTVGDYGSAIHNNLAEGILGIQGGLGTFVQAPAANTLAGVTGARALLDRGLTAAMNWASPGSASINADAQETAQRASRFASDTRAENVAGGEAGWLNPRTLVARLGLGLQEDARERQAEIQKTLQETNPEFMRQSKAVQDAQGFFPTLGAMAQNPMALAGTMARSAPDMALGLGVARLAATRTLAGAGGAADAAAARAAAAGGDALAQGEAAKAAVDATAKLAVERASQAGMLAESVSSANQARESVYQEVKNLPPEKLAASPRFQKVLREVGGDVDRAREVLANELADQAVTAGLGTMAGSLATRRLFGGDSTAKAVAGTERMTAREIPKNMLEESVEEGIQGPLEDLAQHGAGVQADPTRQYDLGGSIAQNMVAGAAMSGPSTAGRYAQQRIQEMRSGNAPEPGSPANSAAAVPVSSESPPATTPADPGQISAEKRQKSGRTPAEDAVPASELLGDAPEPSAEEKALTDKPTDLTPNRPRQVLGADTRFSTEAGAKLDASYALMDAGDMVTSHDESLRSNDAYPQELQPRDRERAASATQITGIQARLDPARLGASGDAGTGAPIVGEDGVVESGNARTIALKRVYRANGQQAQDYRGWLRDNAAQFGITPDAVDAMKQPVLVRVRTTPVDRAEFARQANASTVAAMSPSEQARSDANRIEAMDDLKPDDNGDFATSRDFIRRFMARLPVTEQGGMVDAQGQLSATGYARVRNAVLAKAYGDSPVLTRMVESLDDNTRNISRALLMAAPQVAQARQAIGAGRRFDADITPHLVDAAQELSRLRDAGRTVDGALAQAGVFGDSYTPETRALLRFLADNSRRPRKIAEFIGHYFDALDAAGDPNQGELFDAPAPTTTDLLAAAQRSTEGATGETSTSQDTQRGDAGETAQGSDGDGRRPEDAAGDRGSAEGDGAAGPGAQEGRSGWVAFGPDSGTLGIPRGDMPQISAEHRGALVNFLKARGIAAEQQEVPAATLKPTQAEYSPRKVKAAAEHEGGDRSILVSADGHILDGHHQWLAKAQAGEPVKVLRLDAPVQDLLRLAHQFPSSTSVSTAKALEAKAAPAKRDVMVIDGVEYDAKAPNFGLKPLPRTLKDGDPLLKPTVSKHVVTFNGATLHRQAMRDLIVMRAFNGAVHPTDRKPIAHIMGGGGAAGKGTIKGHLIKKGAIQLEGAVQLDPDDIKGKIPEYQQIVDAGDSRAAAVVHEESSAIAKRILAKAMQGKYDIVYDVTMGHAETGKALLQSLKDAGYDVRLYGVTIDPATAVIRADGRARRTGRYVPTSALLAAHKGFMAAFPEYAKLADQAFLLDNTDARKDLAEKVQDGDLKVVDREAYNVAVARAEAINEQAETLADVGRGAAGTAPNLDARRDAGSDQAPGGAREEGDGGRQGVHRGVVLPGEAAASQDRLSPADNASAQQSSDTRASSANDRRGMGGAPVPGEGRTDGAGPGGQPEPERRGPGPGADGSGERGSAPQSGLTSEPGDRLSRAAPGGIPIRTLMAVASRVAQRLPGLPRVHVLMSPESAPQALQDHIHERGAMGDVEGAFHEGAIYLFASGIKDEARAEHVLAEHEAAHAGLRGLLGAKLGPTMQAIENQNAAVRKAAAALRAADPALSVAESVEEVLVDMPSADLAKLKGWRALVGRVRDWLAGHGFERMAAQIDGWLAGHLSEQEKADLVVAELVRAARSKFESAPAAPVAVRTFAFDKASGTVVADFSNDQPLKASPDYKAAKGGDVQAAARLVQELVKPASIEQARERFGSDAVYLPVHAEEASGRNMIPLALAHWYAAQAGGSVRLGIAQANRAFHTGANAMERLISRTEFTGKVEPGKRYVLVDDVTTMGSTLADLAAYIKANGGEVAGSVVLVNAMRGGRMAPDAKVVRELEARHGDEIRKLFGVDPGALTASEAQYLIGFRTTDELRGRVAAARSARGERLAAKGVRAEGQDQAGLTRLSRAATAQPQAAASTQDAAARADKIINTSAATPAPIDAAFRFAIKVTGIEKVASVMYDKGAQLLDRFTPERVKAGIVHDYGVPEAVTDQRIVMHASQSTQLRKVGSILEKLASMTRAEARVAYDWMNREDTRTADQLMKSLPELSVKVLQEVQTMIDELSQEAVRLGQLKAEDYERHKFAYLKRSYLKYAQEFQNEDDPVKEQASRERVLAILGDQYKGRGMFDPVAMSKIKNLAPDWWQRKVVEGKADTSLKGQKFVRLERRAPSGEGTTPIEGTEGKRPGKLQEVHFYPAGEPLPAKYGDWTNAGTWEVRDVKGGDAVMWRDFTKEERRTMGEIDEARFAIAKTLHGMIHDVEVGRYLEWIAKTQAKKEGEEIPGTVVDANERGRNAFKPDEWVKVPDTKITGTSVARYGLLAGRYLPGPVWNDVRQTTSGTFMPLGKTYQQVLNLWKVSKALALDTPIPTPTGWTTMGAIQVGDMVFDELGQPCQVLGATDVQLNRRCYEVAFSDGTKIVADAEHLWFTIRRGSPGVRTTEEIRATLKERTRGDANHVIPVAGALQLDDVDLRVPPYVLGAWLGDGDSNRARITQGGADAPELIAHLEAAGVSCAEPSLDRRSSAVTFWIRRGEDGCARGHSAARMTVKGCTECANLSRRLRTRGELLPPGQHPSIQERLRFMGLLGNKHIPAAYLRGSEKQRRELLMGLMDTDGNISDRGLCSFTTTLPALRDGVLELMRSLGYKPTLGEFQPMCNGKPGKTAWRIHFKAYADAPVFKLSRKRARLAAAPARRQRSQTRAVVAITPVPSVPVRCIAVSSKSRLYLAGTGMVPTHNTALSPAVHMNNVMSNFVMADWHDVTAGHIAKALRIMLGAMDQDRTGALGRAGNALSRGGILDREAAQQILARYQDSGGNIGTWAMAELKQEQLAPIVAALEEEQQAADKANMGTEVGVMAGLQHLLHLKFPEAWHAFKTGRGGQIVRNEASNLIELYQSEDDVFRLAAWLKAKEEGGSDIEAGKAARKSFLDYNINAPWIQAMRSTAFPFISFTYRAAPLLLETMGKRPHKLVKLMALAGALNTLGVMLAGGGDDKERKLLPEEKAGRVWGMVPKLVRMPWNDANGSPVYLDIRRWIPVGDVADVGAGHAAMPILPMLMPGGPLALMSEIYQNNSMFTGKPITLETDTGLEKTGKILDYLWKAFAPNLLGVPGTYATSGVKDAMTGATDKFGREQSVAQALLSSVGIKLGSYPADVLRANLMAKHHAEEAEIDKNISALRRQLMTHKIDQAEFADKVKAQNEKKLKLLRELSEKMN